MAPASSETAVASPATALSTREAYARAGSRRSIVLEQQVLLLEQAHPNSFLSVMYGVYVWGGWAALKAFVASRPRKNFNKLAGRGYMLHHNSSLISWWNWAMVGVAVYSTTSPAAAA